MQHNKNILCCCSAGQVRSVATKFILTDEYRHSRVLSAGLDKLDPATLEMLLRWSDIILVVGEPELMGRIPLPHVSKAIHLDVGTDTYGKYNDQRLLEKLRPLIKRLRMAETVKSRARREREGWFEKYAPPWMSGIDIGCQKDFLNHTFRRWDMIYEDGDATFMEGIPDNQFTTVYASHVLEHLNSPEQGLLNWFRILRPGGHLIVCVPHRDLYEKRTTLPSRWNPDHKSFWLPETGEPPVTLGLRETVQRAIPNGTIVSLRTLDEGWVSNGDHHSGGEYSIEVIVRK